jgi:hypothetical protein
MHTGNFLNDDEQLIIKFILKNNQLVVRLTAIQKKIPSGRWREGINYDPGITKR